MISYDSIWLFFPFLSNDEIPDFLANMIMNGQRSWTKLNLSSHKETSLRFAPSTYASIEKDDMEEDISKTISLEESKRIEEREGIINDDEYEGL